LVPPFPDSNPGAPPNQADKSRYFRWFIGFGFLCWLLFTLAIHALPALVGLTASLAAYHGGRVRLARSPFGLIAGALTLAAGRIAIAAFRSPVVRAAIALLFAGPAAMAGYYAVLGLARSSAHRQSCGSRPLR